MPNESLHRTRKSAAPLTFGGVAAGLATDRRSPVGWLVPKLKLGNPVGKLQLPGESGERDVKHELHALRSQAGA